MAGVGSVVLGVTVISTDGDGDVVGDDVYVG